MYVVDGAKSGAPSPVLHKAGLVALTLLLGNAITVAFPFAIFSYI